MKKIIVPFIFLLFGAVTLQGCLPEEPPIAKRISLRFNADNLDTDITRGDDTIYIDEVKLVLDKFNLLTEGEAALETAIDILVMRYTDRDGLDAIVIESNIGFDFSRFTGIHLFIAEPNDDDAIDDPELRDGSETYAVIINGTYNGDEFSYRSQLQHDEIFEFDSTVRLDADEETLRVRVLTDVVNWIIDPQTDQILDPTIPDNSTRINQLIAESLSVEGDSYRSLPL